MVWTSTAGLRSFRGIGSSSIVWNNCSAKSIPRCRSITGTGRPIRDPPTYGALSIATVMSDGFADATRLAALNAIAAHGAYGATSVGDGVEMARTQLNALAPGSYDHKAIIVLTDGLENRPKSIAEVAGSVDNRTFAVGLGNDAQVNTAALTALAGSTGGFPLLSGLLSSSLDDQFRMRKFFLHILAGVTNTSIIRDPTG